MRKNIIRIIKQLLCEHEFSMFYPDVKFRYEREQDEKDFFRAERAVVKKRKAAKLEEARKRKGFRE